jgi:hypothetical protein
MAQARNTRVTLLIVLSILLVAGTLGLNFQINQSAAAARGTALALDRDLAGVQLALSDYRAAQTAYLAAGQGPDFWMRRAHELAALMTDTLGRLRDSSGDAAVRDHYDGALAALADLARLDERARTQIESGERFTASDILFSEALEPSQRASTRIADARAAESRAFDAADARLAWIQFGANGLALVLVLALAFAAGRAGRPKAAVSEAAATALMIRALPPPVKNGAASRTAPAPPASPAAVGSQAAQPTPAQGTPAPLPQLAPPAAAAPPVPVPAAPSVALPDAAELCVDLARVIDARDVPSLLERAARVLDAKGVIIWTVDRSSEALRPSLSHGYADKVLARMGELPLGADNVTSLAYRSMRPQTMPAADPRGSAAIAVPLITSAGCAGVLAAETRTGRPAPELIAVARIIAAQFASLIGPAEDTGHTAGVRTAG